MITYLVILLCVLLQSKLSYAATNQPAQCMVVKNDIFDDCMDKQKRFKDLSKKQKLGNNSKEVCINEGICRNNFNITYLKRQLYNLKLFNQFSQMLEGCCGNCASYSIVNTISRISQINKSTIETSDIIFPILGSRSLNRLYGCHYIPVLEAPSAYYFTLRATKKENMINLILGCLSTWPLVVICLLMSCISGFIVWMMERKVNSAEFPKPFHEGLSEGFWWSFVSMTTVGYGDKSPRTWQGRLFAVFWILIGITIFSLLTASLTTQITNIHSHPSPQLLGKRVGGLKHKFHDATMVAQHGGFFEDIEFNNTVIAVVDLIKRLERRTIDGIILSRASYYYFSWVINNSNKYKRYAAEIKNVQMDITEKQFLREKLTLGMLVKNNENYEYFRTYFEDNWLQIQDCNAFNLNKKTQKFVSKFSGSHFEGFFYDFLYGILGILGIIGCIGLLLEGRRRYQIYKANRNENDENGRLNEMKII